MYLRTTCIVISFNEYKFPSKALLNPTSDDDENSIENQLKKHLVLANTEDWTKQFSFFEY